MAVAAAAASPARCFPSPVLVSLAPSTTCRLASQRQAQLELAGLPTGGRQQPVAMAASEADVGELSLPPVTDVDGVVLPAPQARTAAKRYYYAGFAALPWFWAVNIWLYFPDFWHGRDPVVAKCEWGRTWVLPRSTHLVGACGCWVLSNGTIIISQRGSAL